MLALRASAFSVPPVGVMVFSLTAGEFDGGAGTILTGYRSSTLPNPFGSTTPSPVVSAAGGLAGFYYSDGAGLDDTYLETTYPLPTFYNRAIFYRNGVFRRTMVRLAETNTFLAGSSVVEFVNGVTYTIRIEFQHAP